MSKKISSLTVTCILLSILFRTTGYAATIQPDVSAPTANNLNVELVGHWSTVNVLDLSVYGNNAYVSRYFAGPPVEGILSTVDVSNSAQPKELDQLDATYDEAFHATYADLSHIYVAEDELNGASPHLPAYRNDNMQMECFSPVGGTGLSRCGPMQAIGSSLSPTPRMPPVMDCLFTG